MPPSTDCTISLEYRPVPVGTSPYNHAFILITGPVGTDTIEGEPQHPAAGAFLGYWGSLQGQITPGQNGYNNSDNPQQHKVTQQGNTFDDPDCVLTSELLGLAPTVSFNQASGAPSSGWQYAPVPGCFGALGCTANSNAG